MTLEKILVGDDNIDFARKIFPFIPDTEIEFVANPDELIRKALSGTYSTIVTDLNYTENGEEGYMVLEALKEISSRKVLWTGNAYDGRVRDKGQSLGAEVLDKGEIGALVGQIVNKAPLKQGGKVLVYVSGNGPIFNALKKITDLSLFSYQFPVVVSSDLKGELATGLYGLVIDTSTIMSHVKGAHGTVAHDMKYITLDEVPRVATVHNVLTVVADIAKITKDHYLSSPTSTTTKK